MRSRAVHGRVHFGGRKSAPGGALRRRDFATLASARHRTCTVHALAHRLPFRRSARKDVRYRLPRRRCSTALQCRQAATRLAFAARSSLNSVAMLSLPGEDRAARTPSPSPAGGAAAPDNRGRSACPSFHTFNSASSPFISAQPWPSLSPFLEVLSLSCA